MKRHILLFLMFILMNASFAMAEWTGDTLKPERINGCYQISSPEEYAWMVTRREDRYDNCFKLVSDIVLGKDKNSVHREHEMKPISFYYINVDFNGYSVYGAYTESQPFLSCGNEVKFKDISFKNFEIHVKDSTWDKYEPVVSAVSLGRLCKHGVEGNVVAEGTIKLTGDSVTARVYGGSFVDGVIENRTSLEVDANYAAVSFSGIGYPNNYAKDSNLVQEVVNYADVSIKAKTLLGLSISGVCPLSGTCDLEAEENLYKISNYGNITVEVKEKIDGDINVSGIGNFEGKNDKPLELYNEGNISIKTDSLNGIFKIAGLSTNPKSMQTTYRKFGKAHNRGNISVYANQSGNASTYNYIGGCIGSPDDSLENLLNEGNIDVHLGNFVVNHDYIGESAAVKIGGVAGTAKYIKNAVNVGNINVSVKKTPKEESLWYFTGVGGLAGWVGSRIESSANFGTVETEFVEYVGGVAGLLGEADAVQVMNFADVTAKKATYLGGVLGALHGNCYMEAGSCYRDYQYLTDMANLGNVTSLDSTCKSVGGLAGESYEDFFNSYNAGKVVKIVSADSVYRGNPFSNRNTLFKGSPTIEFFHTYYNWNAYYESSAKPEYLVYEDNARTTDHMQSKDFVKELNYVDSTNTNSKVWTLSKLYPYPIIADMEDILKENKDRLPIIPVRKNKSIASFGLSAEGMNLLVSGARVGIPYAVFDLLGKSISRGRISSQNQIIPVVNAGTYVVKVGKSSRSIVVK